MSAAARVGRLFALDDAARTDVVYTMLSDGARTTAGYWLQLTLAMGIATLGLVLGSTAVVIGAMLVSPLMTPIVALGMGLAVGSPLLVLRSTGRVVASLVFVPLAAMGVVALVPLHEMTDEIASRTSPTVLDLAVAAFCAAAGVYAAIRRGADTASTAAGTAIGLALVPPLCVVGFGVGSGSRQTAEGAALLFTANFCAILLVAVLGFLVLGFGHVDVGAVEARHVSEHPPSSFLVHLARRVSAVFASAFGGAARVLMPLLLVVLVAWPLSTALAEVRWEVRVRTAAQHALHDLPEPAVHSAVRIQHHRVSITLVAIATEERARRIRAELEAKLRAVSGTDPVVEVFAVADASALARAETTLARPATAPSVPSPKPLAALEESARPAFAAWPTDAAGPLLAWRMTPSAAGALVEVVHAGAPLGGPASSMLGRALGEAWGSAVTVRDVALPTTPLRADPGEPLVWLAAVAERVASLRAVPLDAAALCVELPAGHDAKAVTEALETSSALADPHVHVGRGGDALAATVSLTGCDGVADAGAD